jgi:DNA-binding beta-propeller fold protein YncE
MGPGCEIAYEASGAVLAALARLQRTEDVAFSPNGRRLALAAFDRNVIAIADVCLERDGRRPRVTVTVVTELSSPRLNGPHGVEFLDDDTILVGNRRGDVSVFRLPEDGARFVPNELEAIDLPAVRGFKLLDGPAALAIADRTKNEAELLVCNTYGNRVTSHLFDRDAAGAVAVTANRVLVARRLVVPDGVAVSPDGAWIAVSNHAGHRVMLYERSSSVHEASDPQGILRGAWCPHGICFSADGRALFVADADSLFIHVYERNGDTWRGVQFHPADSVQAVDGEAFERWHRPGRQGGPKGLGIDRDGHVLAVTFEHQPPAFFDVGEILRRCAGRRPNDARQLTHELQIMDQEQLANAWLEARVATIEATMSWRITKPLRRLKATWVRFRSARDPAPRPNRSVVECGDDPTSVR